MSLLKLLSALKPVVTDPTCVANLRSVARYGPLTLNPIGITGLWTSRTRPKHLLQQQRRQCLSLHEQMSHLFWART